MVIEKVPKLLPNRFVLPVHAEAVVACVLVIGNRQQAVDNPKRITVIVPQFMTANFWDPAREILAIE